MSDTPARLENGQFPKGTSGNPLGRPRKADIADLKLGMEAALREHVPVDKLKKIVDRMVALAAQGDIKAAKLILEFFISKARETEDAPDAARTYVFKIENATFGAITQDPQQNSNSNVIDVTPEET